MKNYQKSISCFDKHSL